MKYLLSVAIGVGLGYFGAVAVLEKKYILKASNDIADAEEYYKANYVRIPEKTVEDYIDPPQIADIALDEHEEVYGASPLSTHVEGDLLVKDASEALLTYQGQKPPPFKSLLKTMPPPAAPKVYNTIKQSVLDKKGTGTRTRSFREPFVVGKNEFERGDVLIEAEAQIVYYAGDGVVTNLKDETVIDPAKVAKMVGDPAKLPYGHKSGTANIVFMRCEELRMDIEVLREEGKFSEDVLNLGVEEAEDVLTDEDDEGDEFYDPIAEE